MELVLAHYWPFAVVALGLGVCVGWWAQSPGAIDQVTAWLQREGDDR